MRILIVEDERKAAHYLHRGLTESGFVVDVALDGDDGLHLALEEPYDLIVLDVGLPRRDGWSVLSSLRRAGRQTPVLFLTARDTVEDRRVADLEIDVVRHRASRCDQRLDLTPKEFALLTLLVRRRGEVLSRTLISELVWEMNFDSDTNVVDVAVRRLRAKVDDPYDRKLIRTVRGVGYVIDDE